MCNNSTKITKKEVLRICLCLFVFAMAVRGIYYCGFMNNPYFNYIPKAFDQINFDEGAMAFANGDIMAKGGGESYAPLYKYFLGIIYWIFGRNFYAIWAVQFTLGAISAVLMFLITIRFFNKWVGIICSVFYALYGPNIFYEGKLIREALTEFLAIILFYLLLRYKEETKFRYAVLSGIFLSLLIQCRPNTIFLLPFCVYYVIAVVLKDYPVNFKAKQLLCFIGLMVIIGTPLMVRTVLVHKKVVFYDASGPQTLLVGNVPEYEGVGWNDQNMINRIKENVDSNNTMEVIKYVFKRFCSSPLDYIKLYGRKIYWFFNNYEYPSNANYYLYQDFSPVLKNPLGNFSLPVSLSFVGIVLTCRNYRKYLIIYFFIVGLILSTIIFYPTSRFRISVVPFFMIFASYSTYYICRRIYQKKVLASSLLCIAPAALLVYFLKTPESHFYKIRPVDYNNLAGSFWQRNIKQFDLYKSEKYFIKGWNTNSEINLREIAIYDSKIDGKKPINGARIVKNPVSGAALLYVYLGLLGNAYLAKDYDKLIEYSTKAVEVDYKNLKAHEFAANAYLKKEDYVNAIKEFEIRSILDPKNADIFYNLAGLYNNYNLNKERAIFYFKKALNIDKDIVKKMNLDSELLENTINDNMRKIDQGLELNRDKIRELWGEAKDAVKENQFEKAITNCEKIINIDFGNINAHNGLAFSYNEIGRHSDSISEYIIILTINPDVAGIHKNLFLLYKNNENIEKNDEKAIYHLKQSLKLDPGQENHEELAEDLETLKEWSRNMRFIKS